jgi:Fe-S-cluster containining protein
MEIAIDFVRVRRVIREEYALARTEIRELGVSEAYARSLERLDAQLANASDAHTLACKTGCSWCCHFSIDLRPVEIFRIMRFVEDRLDANARERIRQQVAMNQRITAGLDEMQRMQHNLPCPFLVESRCSIYSARPQTCRNYHATDAAGCRKSFEEPQNLEIDPEFAPIVYQVGGAVVEAFAKAMQDEGYDVDAYEMNVALHAAFNEPAAGDRFQSKGRPFDTVMGEEVPEEFDEDENPQA